MAKKREGKLPPAINADDITPNDDITEKYITDDNEPAPGVHKRHPNRNTGKDEENAPRNPQAVKSMNQTYIDERSIVEPEELPGILYKSLFEQLARHEAECCTSVYLPTHSAGLEVNEQQDRIAFKNTLQQVRVLLQEKGLSQPQIEKIIEPGYKLLRESDLWHNLTNGLAVFMAENFFKYARLTITPKEEILTNKSFYLRPLVPALIDTGNDYFYLLVLSKKRAAFFRGDAFYLEEIIIEELPLGVEDVVHFEEKDDRKLFRLGDSGTASANFHGVGAGKPDEKENLAFYMKEIDRVLWQKVLGREQAPLLLAGIDYLIPIYKSVSSYQFIWDNALTGNFEHHSVPMLYISAREKMASFFDKHHKTALDTYYNKLATPLTSSMPESVIPSCYYGKVADLFVDDDTHLWGTFDAQNNKLQLHPTRQQGDDDMVDKAVIETILHGGKVHLLEKERMPKGSTIAALMRY